MYICFNNIPCIVNRIMKKSETFVLKSKAKYEKFIKVFIEYFILYFFKFN